MSHVQHSPAARTWAASIIPRTPPRQARPASNSRTSGPLPPAGHHDLHGPERRRARLPASLAPAFAAQHLPDHDTTGLARSLGLDSGADAALEREILLAMLGSPVPFPSRPCPSWSPPSASAAASSRPRARPPWPSTPSTPSAPRAIGPTTKNAASPSCPAARSSKACAAPPARGLGPALRLLLLPRDGVRHGAGHRPGA